MTGRAPKPIVTRVAANVKTAVVVAGAGVAGLEFVLAVRDLAGDRVDITVVDPRQDFVYEPNAVVAVGGGGEVERFDIEALLEDAGAERVEGTLEEVADEPREAMTSAGVFPYDVLVVAHGGRRVADVPGALTFLGSESVGELRALVERLHAPAVRNLVFAVPRGLSWHLPLYELALGVARTARVDELDLTIDLVTPEEAPLGIFGEHAGQAIRQLLDESGIVVWPCEHVVAIEENSVRLLHDRMIPADAVVMVPRLLGQEIRGLPVADDGFVAASTDGRVRGLDRVFVIGDASPFPLKQGGIATQQADTVACIAAGIAGASVEPQPFEPVLRGLLLTGTATRYLRSELVPGHGESSDIATEPLWWPPAKIAGRYLGPFLAERIGRQPSAPTPSDHVAVDVALDPELRR